MLDIFPSWVACTSKETGVVVSMEGLYEVEDMDLLFEITYNMYLFEVVKMDFLFEITYNMYRASSMFALAAVGRGDILVPGNPPKEIDIWKGKCEAMENKCITFKNEVAKLKEKAKLANSLQEDAKTYDFPSTMET